MHASERTSRSKADLIAWLLEGEDPSLRFRVLVDLLDRPLDSEEVKGARNELMRSGLAYKVLASQAPGGHWGREEDFYVRSKYKGTVWNLILLAELGADPEDERVHRAGDFVLRWSQRSDGGFTYLGGPKGGRTGSLPCLTGNMVQALLKLGFHEDPRLEASVGMLKRLALNDRTALTHGRCSKCRSGRVKVLKGLVEARSTANFDYLDEDIRNLAEELIATCLPRTADDPKVRPEWSRFGFPLMWNTDLVEILDLLAKAGRWDERMEPALDIVLSGQDREGRWPMAKAYNDRMLVRFDKKGLPSKWVTLRVLSMLKHMA